MTLPRATALILAFTPLAYAHEGDAKAPGADTAGRPAVTTGGFTTVPGWGSIPETLKVGPTHGGVVVDKAGLIYMSSDSAEGIYVFKPDGTLVKTIAKENSGIHGLAIREENGTEYLYAAHLRGAQALKLTLAGEVVLKIPSPAESNAYPEGKGYKPTGIAIAPDGSIFVTDGYGLSLIHKFDAAGKYLKTFGGKGKEDGKFMTSHGIAIDSRSGKPLLLVCDRENRRIVHLDLEGNYVDTIATDLRRPCAVSILGDLVAVAELESRVIILDKTNKIVATLGDNPDKSQWANFGVPPEQWHEGIFTAPHGLSFDAQGNLYVQDWNKTGRLTKLVKRK